MTNVTARAARPARAAAADAASSARVERELRAALREIRFGSITLTTTLPAAAQAPDTSATPTAAQPDGDERALCHPIEELDQRLRILECKRAIEAEQAVEKARLATSRRKP